MYGPHERWQPGHRRSCPALAGTAGHDDTLGTHPIPKPSMQITSALHHGSRQSPGWDKIIGMPRKPLPKALSSRPIGLPPARFRAPGFGTLVGCLHQRTVQADGTDEGIIVGSGFGTGPAPYMFREDIHAKEPETHPLLGAHSGAGPAGCAGAGIRRTVAARRRQVRTAVAPARK